MFQDFKDLLSAFNAHGVKYLVVGGHAVSLHSQPRATKDLDLFVKADTANAQAIYDALKAFGAPVSDISPADLTDQTKFIRFGQEPVAVDILPHIDGVDFDHAWERRLEKIIEDGPDLVVFFISREDLIASKLAAGRTRDLADVEEIQQAQANAKKPDENES